MTEVGPIETKWRSYAERTLAADSSEAMQTFARSAFWSGAISVIDLLGYAPGSSIESIASELKRLHAREDQS